MGAKPSQEWSAKAEANSYDVEVCRFEHQGFEQTEAQRASFSLWLCG